MKDFWKNKNVFLTGINGFIGGNLAKVLIENGANVFGLIRNIDQNSFLFHDGYDKKVALIEGDLIDRNLMERAITEEILL